MDSDSGPPTPRQLQGRAPARTFVGYAPEDQRFCAELEKHLHALKLRGLIDVWHQGKIGFGDDFRQGTLAALRAADLVLLLVSADFVASEDSWRHVRVALDRAGTGEVDVVVIHARAVDLAGTSLAAVQALPRDGKPIDEWEHPDRAWHEVVRALTDILTAADPSRALVARVAEVARLHSPNAEITPHPAPPPFQGQVLVAQMTDQELGFEPIGVLDGPMTSEALGVFVRDVVGPHRVNNPLLHSRIVHTGARAPLELVTAANQRGVRLSPFTAYQNVVDFSRYLRWQGDRLDRDSLYPERLYVHQRAEVRILLDRESTEDALTRLVELLLDPYPRFVLILGDFGTGKTFLLRQLARRLAREHEKSRDVVPPPVLVEMRSLEKSLHLDRLLAQHFATPDVGRIPVDGFRYMLSEGRVALLLDGFDELAIRLSYERVCEQFEAVLEGMKGRAKVVVTSRTAHFLTDNDVELTLAKRAANVDGYRLIKLQPFDERQIEQALVKRLGCADEARQRMTLLREVEDLMGLSTNPRMLGFILDLPIADLKEARTREGRITSAGLYQLLCNRWLEGEVARGGAQSTLNLQQLWRALTDLALLLWPRGGKGLPGSDIPESLWASLRDLDPSRQIEPGEAKLAVGSRSLLVRDDDGRFSFVHASILDWLVARSAAEQLAKTGTAPVLSQNHISDLIADFFVAAAGPEGAAAWARARSGGGSGIMVANANRVLKRLGAEVDEDEPPEADHLSNLNLRGTDFSGSKRLRAANLRGADLRDATLAGADLSRADLSGAALTAVNAENAILREANLETANLEHARLMGADLRGARLAEAKARYAKLVNAEVGPEWMEGVDTFGAALPNPHQATPAMLAAPCPRYGGASTNVAVSPDGALLAAGYGGGTVVCWDVASGRAIRAWACHDAAVSAVVFSPDGSLLASASHDHTVRLWPITDDRPLPAIGRHSLAVQCLAFSPDGRMIASGSRDKKIKLWSLTYDTGPFTLGDDDIVCCMAFSLDGKILISGSADGELRLWDPKGHALIRTCAPHRAAIQCMAVSPDGRRGATGSRDRTIKLWDIATGRVVRTIEDHPRAVQCIAYSPDGEVLASGSLFDKNVHLWDARSGRHLRSIEAHMSAVQSLVFSSDRRTLAVGGQGQTVHLLEPASGQLIRALDACSDPVQSVVFSPDAQTLASSSRRGVLLWAPRTGRLLRRIDGHSSQCVAFSGDGQSLASGAPSGHILVCNAQTGDVRRTIQAHAEQVTSVAFSPDARILASASTDMTLKLWDTLSGKQQRFLGEHGDAITAIAFSPNGKLLASTSRDHATKVWARGSGNLLKTLDGHLDWVQCVAFSSDGKTLASGSADTTIRLWDAETGARLRIFREHSRAVLSLAISPDGRTLASGAEDRSVKLWDAHTGDLLRSLTGHEGAVLAVAFSPNGLTLASAGADATIRVWRVSDGSCFVVLVPAEQGWAAFTPDGRYKIKGDVGGRFWHVVGLCRFEPGELDAHVDAFARHKPLRLGDDDPMR